MYGNNTPPVREGDELDVKIEAIGDKGDGIAKKDGFVLVVPGTQINDEVRVRVTKVLKRVGFAEVIGKEGNAQEPDSQDSADGSNNENESEMPDAADLPEPEAEENSNASDQPVDSEDFGEE